MGKSTSSKSSSKSSKTSGTKNVNSNKNRLHPMTPKAGVTKSRRRYGDGGYYE